MVIILLLSQRVNYPDTKKNRKRCPALRSENTVTREFVFSNSVKILFRYDDDDVVLGCAPAMALNAQSTYREGGQVGSQGVANRGE